MPALTMRRMLMGSCIRGTLLAIVACGSTTGPSGPTYLTFTAEGHTDSATCCLDAQGGVFVTAPGNPVIELRLRNVQQSGTYYLTPTDSTREARYGRDWVTTFSTLAPGGSGRVTITEFQCRTITYIDPEFPDNQFPLIFCNVGASFNFVAVDSTGASVGVTGRFYLQGNAGLPPRTSAQRLRRR